MTSQSRRTTNRLAAAWLTWRTRPAMLALIVLWPIPIVAALLSVSTERPTFTGCAPAVEIPYWAPWKFNELDELRQSNRLSEVEELRFARLRSDYRRAQGSHVQRRRPRTLPMDRKEKEEIQAATKRILTTPPVWDILKQCTHLRKVSFARLTLEDSHLKIIGRLDQLEELSLAYTKIQADQLRHLRSLPKLSTLDLTGCKIGGGLHFLESLPSLKTLILPSRDIVNDSLLDEISKLPHLETLVIEATYFPGSKKGITERGIDALAQHPTLKTLYVNDGPVGAPFNTLFDTLRARQLPFTARRSTYNSTMTELCGLLLSLHLIVTGMILLFHLPSCLLNSSAAVLPDQSRWHLMIAAALLGTSVLASSAILVVSGAAAWAAGSLVFTLAVAVLVAFRWASPLTSSRPNALQTACFILCLGGGPLLLLMILSGRHLGAPCHAWLVGDYPIAAILFAVVAVLVCRSTFRSLSRAAQEAYEINRHPVGGLRDMQQMLKSRHRKTGPKSKTYAFEADLDRKLEAALARHERAADAGIDRKLFRAANRYSGRWTAKMALFMIAVTLGAMALLRFFRGAFLGDGPFFGMGMFLFILPAMFINAFVGAWRKRMEGIGFDLLRPVSRSQIRRWLFSDLMFQCAGMFAVVALGTIAAAIYWNANIGVSQAIAFGLLGLAVCCLLYGIGLWVILIRRVWLVIVVGMIVLGAFQSSGVYFIGISRFEDEPITGMTLVTVAIIFFAIALIAIRSAWRRWDHLEFG